MGKIYFHDLNINSKLGKRNDLNNFLLDLFKCEKKDLLRVDIIFCTDEFLLALNKKFLKHDYFTDTLSFPLSSPKDPIVGESYISIDRIISNSKKFKESYDIELLRVIIHSCLHLCGYLDKPKKNRNLMLSKQNLYLNAWVVSRET